MLSFPFPLSMKPAAPSRDENPAPKAPPKAPPPANRGPITRPQTQAPKAPHHRPSRPG